MSVPYFYSISFIIKTNTSIGYYLVLFYPPPQYSPCLSLSCFVQHMLLQHTSGRKQNQNKNKQQRVVVGLHSMRTNWSSLKKSGIQESIFCSPLNNNNKLNSSSHSINLVKMVLNFVFFFFFLSHFHFHFLVTFLGSDPAVQPPVTKQRPGASWEWVCHIYLFGTKLGWWTGGMQFISARTQMFQMGSNITTI